MTSDTGPQGERIIVPSASLRNAVITDRGTLMSTVETPVSGAAQAPAAVTGTIRTIPAPLGAVGTDAAGRVIVVGSHGEAGSWVNPAPAILDYLNNDEWFDAIADGPVDAEVVFADGTRVNPDGAWVIVGPPDFVPAILPFVSFYDVMVDALGIAPARVSFEHDVRPILQRAADLHWVNPSPTWRDLNTALQDLNTLADPAPGAASARLDAMNFLLQSEEDLDGFRLTGTQKTKILEPWVNGTFDNDLNSAPRPMPLGAELDYVATTACIGSGFFPGIEIGFMSTNPTLYAELGRFTRAEFTDFGVKKKLEAGMITQRIAVPWQADFIECSRVWWPPQRPDIVRFKEDGTAAPANTEWHRGLVVGGVFSPASHRNMVDHFAKLGVIDKITAGGQTVFAEIGRKPVIP